MDDASRRIDAALARIARATARHRAMHDDARRRLDRLSEDVRVAIAAIDRIAAQDRAD